MNQQLEAANRQIAAAHATEIVKALVAADELAGDYAKYKFEEMFDAIFERLHKPAPENKGVDAAY